MTVNDFTIQMSYEKKWRPKGKHFQNILCTKLPLMYYYTIYIYATAVLSGKYVTLTHLQCANTSGKMWKFNRVIKRGFHYRLTLKPEDPINLYLFFYGERHDYNISNKLELKSLANLRTVFSTMKNIYYDNIRKANRWKESFPVPKESKNSLV